VVASLILIQLPEVSIQDHITLQLQLQTEEVAVQQVENLIPQAEEAVLQLLHLAVNPEDRTLQATVSLAHRVSRHIIKEVQAVQVKEGAAVHIAHLQDQVPSLRIQDHLTREVAGLPAITAADVLQATPVNLLPAVRHIHQVVAHLHHLALPVREVMHLHPVLVVPVQEVVPAQVVLIPQQEDDKALMPYPFL
jgi:hypothetical protein